ncbi:MAG: HD domain-containing protein [Sedimentisphaerales bacterium]
MLSTSLDVMEQEQLEKFRDWFDDYVAGFYGDDEFINANLKLKEEHTWRTCEQMLYLANEQGLPGNQKRIAEVIALFHDIGRFEQFVRYRTYVDGRSVNHCLLGLEVLRQTKVLEDVDETERQLIEKAIEYHGVKELPADLDGDCLLFSKLIRDADKIDALYVMTDCYRQYAENTPGFKLELELPDQPGYSDEVIEALLRRRRIDYSELRTLNDMKLCLLGWVYDVNFAPTLKRIKQLRLLEMLVDFLPKTEDIKRVRQKIFEYVDFRINKETTNKEK